MEIKCKKCGRFLGETEHSIRLMLKCPYGALLLYTDSNTLIENASH